MAARAKLAVQLDGAARRDAIRNDRRLVLLLVGLAVLVGVWAIRPLRQSWLKQQPLPDLAAYVASHPDEGDAALCLGERYLRAAKPQVAATVLAGLTERDRTNARAWLLRSEAEFAAGKLGAAYASLKTAMPVLSDSAEAHWRLGILLERRGQEASAEQEFKRAVELDRDHPGANLELARGELSHLYYAPAVQHLQRARRRDPRNSTVLQLLALAHRSLGDGARAEQDARAAVRADPHSAPAWRALGEVLTTRGDEPALRDAEQAFLKAIELTPDVSEVHRQLGQLYFGRGEYARAAAELQRAIDINPLNRLAYPALVQSCIRLGQNSRANQLSTEYRKIDELDLTIAPLEYSVYAMPENTALRMRLAKEYLRFKRPDLARPQVDKVLELNPRQPDAMRLRDVIKVDQP